MKFSTFFMPILAFTLCLAPLVHADSINLDDSSMIDLSNGAVSGNGYGVSVVNGSGIRVLVAMEVSGDSDPTDVTQTSFKKVRYAWIKAKAGVDANGIDSATIQITPVTQIEVDQIVNQTNYEALGFRYAPVEYQRDMQMGLKGRIAVRALGVAIDKEVGVIRTAAVGDSNGRDLLSLVVHFAVDALGVEFSALAQGNRMVGVSFAHAQGEAGLSLNFGAEGSVRLTVGTDEHLGVGAAMGAGNGFADLFDADIYERLEVNFAKSLALFLEHGNQGLAYQNPSDLNEAYDYWTVGLNATL